MASTRPHRKTLPNFLPAESFATVGGETRNEIIDKNEIDNLYI